MAQAAANLLAGPARFPVTRRWHDAAEVVGLNQEAILMKKNGTEGRQFGRLASTALCAALVLAGSGCVCVTVTGPGQQTGGPGAGQPGGGGSPSSGAFVPVQNSPVQGTQSAICGNSVVAKYVRFSVSSATGQSVLTQTPDPTVTKFKGTVFDVSIPTQPVAVMNTKYYLQWYVNSLPQNKG